MSSTCMACSRPGAAMPWPFESHWRALSQQLWRSVGQRWRELGRQGAALANPVTELRIDVMLPLVDGELEAIYERLNQPGNKLHGLAQRPLHDPQFSLHWREADGEWFAYVEDLANHRLAGYTIFNRLVEVDKRTDKQVRSPHSRFATDYQRRGIASAVYRQVLDDGMNLLSGARQSPGAHGLWNHLARRYESHYVQIAERKQLHYLSQARPQDEVYDQLNTRRLLLGADGSLQSFSALTGMA